MFQKERIQFTLVDVGLMALLTMAALYLGAKAIGAGAEPGYDVKYFWVAGRMWLEGQDPYGDPFGAAAVRLVQNGHVPEIWAYPPTFYPLAALLGLFSLKMAAAVWATANTAMLFGACWFCSSALTPADQEPARVRLFAVLAVLMASLQASALTLVVGQTSLLMAFGASLVLFGAVRKRAAVSAIGLAVLMLKPQIGAAFATTSLLLGREQRLATALAAALSLAAAAPALAISITAPLDWLHEAMRYSAASPANAPSASTGLPVLLHDSAGIVIGSVSATIAAVMIAVLAVALCLLIGQRGPERLLSLSAASVSAFAPLHLYDHTLILLTLFAAWRAQGFYRWLALLGLAILWRAQDVANLTGFHDVNVEIFSGSRIATLGAVLTFGALAAATWRGPGVNGRQR